MRPPDRSLASLLLLVAAIATAAALAGIDARATYGARVTSDEPQYLLSAISLGEDLDLDISDEIADERYLPFHELALNEQTVPLDESGRRISPHDPLLPALLAVPVLLGGWVGAKIALALTAGLAAALTLLLAVQRFGADQRVAAWVVGACFAAPPFAVFGSQVYPALPAAVCVLVGVLAVTEPGSTRKRGWSAATLLVVVALPWLSVKYVPIAAVIALAGLRRERTAGGFPVSTVLFYGVAGLVYLALHQRIYGGWTVYASGDHFVDGEWLVVGSDPNYMGRTRRLIGLIVDRSYGVGAWNPAFLALPPALVWFWRTRKPGRGVVVATIAAGWATATWVALTMHGWWWPGRQIVPVLPLAVAVFAAVASQHRKVFVAGVGAAVAGAATWLWLAWEASTGRRTLVVDFEETAAPWFRLWRLALPDHRRMAPFDDVLTVGWIIAVVVTCALTWRRTPPPPEPSATPEPDSEPSTPPVANGQTNRPGVRPRV